MRSIFYAVYLKAIELNSIYISVIFLEIYGVWFYEMAIELDILFQNAIHYTNLNNIGSMTKNNVDVCI